MNSIDRSSKRSETEMNHPGFGIDPGTILSIILRNWYWFILCLILSFLISRTYIRHTLPVYRSSITILVNESEARQAGANEELLQGLGLPGSMRNIENQMMILRSRDLTTSALRELPFEIEFYHKTVNNKLTIYPAIPLKIVAEHELSDLSSIEFSFGYLGKNNFLLEFEYEGVVYSKKAMFGETIESPNGYILIEARDIQWLEANSSQKLFFVINRFNDLITSFNNRINVESVTRGGSVLTVSIEGTNSMQDVDFLNKLAEVFQAMSLDKKNKEANRRIQFIDDQLIGISDSLSITENKLQNFRSSYRVMDLSAQGQSIIAQMNILENEKARLKLEANYYDYLADYLAKDVSKEVPIVPITMGITDPGLTNLVTQLADLQGQLLERGAGELNPLQGLLSQRVRSTKEALLETLNGLRRANSLARSENEEQITKLNRQASALPATERQLLGIERKFRLNDELYTYLLETRANQLMQKASNVPDSEVIDPADPQFSTIIAPDPKKVYFIGLFAGAAIPFILFSLLFMFNNKVKDDDLKKMTDLPVVGNIPHSVENTNLIVLDYPQTVVAEAFRLLRSRMQFFTKETTTPVILITSSIPGEGKTYISINLASAYSLLGKKTILVGFDLRKPKIHQDFNLTNEKGVSTWLIGQDAIEDIIFKTAYDNLFVIPSGPVPPNPSELTALGKTDQLINYLKENYDYIIIDSSPLGLVSDTYHLASLSDACIIVIKPGKTLRGMLRSTLMEISNGSVKGVSIAINDIKSDRSFYNYGEKSGYISNDNNVKKSIIKRIFKMKS